MYTVVGDICFAYRRRKEIWLHFLSNRLPWQTNDWCKWKVLYTTLLLKVGRETRLEDSNFRPLWEEFLNCNVIIESVKGLDFRLDIHSRVELWQKMGLFIFVTMLPKCEILTPFDQTNMGSISKPNPNLTLYELGIAPLDFKSRDS